MWKMLQQKKPDDFVISTGKQYTVKHFVNLVLNELKIKYYWKGKNLNTACFVKGSNQKIVSIDKNYFRPLEVDTLLGNSNKARKFLKWKPKYNVKQLVKEMVSEELYMLSNDKKIR